MTHLANILIATDDPTLGQALLGLIARYNYGGRLATSLDDALSLAQAELPDVILVGGSVGDCTPLAFGETLKRTPALAEIPVCLVVADASADLKARAYAAGIDDVISRQLDETKLGARLRPLVRLSTMLGELRRRAQTVRRFGFELAEVASKTTVDQGYPLLLVGPDSAVYASNFADAKVTHAADPYAAEELLDKGPFDAALLVPESNPGPYLDLCALTRNNPRLFNLPVVMVSAADRVGETVAYHFGASAYFATPADTLELRTAVLSLVRRQTLRWSIRRLIGTALQASTRDAETGVFTREFFDADLRDRVTFATTHNRQLTVSFFQVPDIQEIRDRFGVEQADHLRLQVAQWITGLLRGEDLTARYEDNEFCVILPDTSGDEAEIVMKRISGVLAYTDFAVKDVYQPVKVWLRVGAAHLEPRDSAASLVKRARRNFLS